ncbi:MAG: carboxypeptidase, partial [Gemmatimonadetes bacterium]|nr:carboxypeptidase [Gemmatimonadota bacterium]
MDKPPFDRYLRHDELTAQVQQFEREFDVAHLESIGTSHEGRDIWALTITGDGDPLDKPGFLVDGNIHGSEVTASATALYFAWTLLSGYGKDETITRLVDGTAIYVIPVISPDGVELVLSGTGWVRSGTRMYPHEEERPGLHMSDVDGDGRILSMRMEDPGGGWKISTQDERLLVPRRFNDHGGTYYRVFPEGLITDFDGVEVGMAPAKQGLDFNRNFGANWQPEAKQSGAGEYPMSEPETRALAAFVTAHPNICGVHSLHTGMESIIRPPSTQTDKQMPPEDLRRIWEIARLGVEETGYILFSDYKLNDDVYAIHGDFGCWCYEFLGLVAFTVELWDLRARGGRDYLELSEMNKKRDLDGLEEVEAALLRWNDETLDGEGFTDWYAFEHPQLGAVEIGGWRRLLRNNAPERLLEETCAKETRFLLAHAQASPRLHAEFHEVEALGDGVYRIAVAVRNDGYLPTQVTEQAQMMKYVRPVEARIEPAAGAQLMVG